MWFKVDDKLHDHRKVRAARKAAMGVWVLAGSWSADTGSDGFVPRSVLTRWGTPRDAAALVDAGLWHPGQRHGEDGWQFHDWHIFQPSAVVTEAIHRAEAEAGVRGNHTRWHTNRGISDPDCEYCYRVPDQEPDGDPDRVDIGGKPSGAIPPVPVPVPVPVPDTFGKGKSRQSQTVTRGVNSDGLTRIQQLTNGDEQHAQKCAAFVLAKTNGEIRDPVAYVLAAIRDDPDAYRYRRGNPKREQECPTHAGQWADACAGCAADRKASA